MSKAIAITALDAAQIDARMTAHRREAKYLVTADEARAVAAVCDRELESHRHRGEGANKLPTPHHYVTTIYFDTASRELFHAAKGSADHIKLRAKEYYDLHPGLTETATDARQLVRNQPILWLELKSRKGAHTGKQRIGIPKRDVPVFFTQGRVTPEMIAIQERTYASEASNVLASIAELCRCCTQPLRADCLVNYRRTAWQDHAGDLRVTIDNGLAFFAPPADLWDRDWALVRPTLGASIATEPRRVLEIKSCGEQPPWLVELLRERGIVAAAFSKFEAASVAVHG